MHKTSAYLPAVLKLDLERTIRTTGRSAAKFIRVGIRLAIAQQNAPAPHSAIFDRGDPLIAERIDELLAEFGRS